MHLPVRAFFFGILTLLVHSIGLSNTDRLGQLHPYWTNMGPHALMTAQEFLNNKSTEKAQAQCLGLRLSEEALDIMEVLSKAGPQIEILKKDGHKLRLDYLRKKDISAIQTKYELSGTKLTIINEPIGHFRVVATHTRTSGGIKTPSVEIKITANCCKQ